MKNVPVATESVAMILSDPKPPLLVKEKKVHKNLHGIAFSLLCSFFSTLGHVLVKKAQITSGSEQAFVRYLVQGLIMSFFVCLTNNSFLGEKSSRKFLAVRGFFGMLAMLCIHFAIKFITPSDAVALIHLNTVFVALIARLALNEKISLVHVVCLMVSGLGVWFITQPTFLFQTAIENGLDKNTTGILSKDVIISETEFILGITLGNFNSI